MMAMLRFLNGDKLEIGLTPSQCPSGRPVPALHWQDGRDGLGGEYVGVREFWLDLSAHRSGFVRYDEVRRGAPAPGEGKAR